MDTDSKSQDSSFVASPIVDDDDNSILNANECNKAINNDEATASNEPKEEPPSSALGAGSPDNKSQDSGATSPKSHELKNSSDPESSSNSSPMAALDDTADGIKAGERGDDDDGTNAKHMDIPKMESPTVSQESNSNEITNSGQDPDQGQSPGPNQRDEEDSTVAEAATKSQIHSQAAIPENILSPPKSETQTDETNTATSSSPASDSQLSPLADVVSNPMASAEAEATSAPVTPTTPETEKLPANAADERISQPINIVANGIIPNSGKPLMSSMNKKLNKSSSRSTRQRKAKPLVAMYESEISDNKVGIKLCIKKSDTTSSAATTADPVVPAPVATPSKAAPSKASAKKRSRKAKSSQRMDSDDSEYETKRKKSTSSNNNSEQKQKKVAFAAGVGGDKDTRIREPVEQGDWGAKIPEEILCKIFRYVVDKEGCLPTLFRIGRVCTLWRQVSLSSELWKSLDLTTWIKDKHRTELKLKWFIDNRCRSCTDLNVSNWKITDINCFLNKLSIGCPNLSSITLSGWKGFTSDHLTFLVTNMKKLKRIDLSSINVEMNASKSAVGLQSLCNALQTMKDRLTHLYLAHNRLAGIPQIVNILSKHCPNLVLLDLSNVHTQATSHGILHIEKLQHGCQKLRVLRVTNSHVTLGPASMQEMMNSPGFPDLEELSVAALTDESRVMGDEHLQRILKTSSKLKLLDVRNCTRLTHESLIRLPAWDIKHLFLSGCSVTRDVGSGLELIASKWAHSLIELDLAWANVQHALDNALRALAEKGSESPLAHLNLCGSSVSEEAVKEILANCAHMSSINLASCRGLPRGVKRLMQGPTELQELRDVLKVQMKVKLPSQIKREQEEAAAAAAADEKMDVDRGGEGDGSGGGGGCGIESNNSN